MEMTNFNNTELVELNSIELLEIEGGLPVPLLPIILIGVLLYYACN